MRAIPNKTRDVDEVLSRLGAKLEGWQVRALFLGAQTSTNVRLGPQHLFEHLFGPEPVFGDDNDDANANLESLMALWNHLVESHGAGTISLSKVEVSDPPEQGELEALAKRRQDEITWFLRGIDAGGDDPIEFGDDGKYLFQKLGEASAFFEAYQDLLRKKPVEEPGQARKPIEQLTGTVETIMNDLMTVSDGIRKQAMAEYKKIAGSRADDGAPVRRPVKIGRNDLCPCGSGRKWKRCCGAPSAMH